MKKIPLIYLLFVFLSSCNTTPEDNALSTIEFDSETWKQFDGDTYPFRETMYENILYNDSIRALSKNEIITLLGQPNRTNEDFLYYLIAEKKLGFWVLHTKTLVFKFNDSQKIEWIKIHE